jgi:hypothetical protein
MLSYGFFLDFWVSISQVGLASEFCAHSLSPHCSCVRKLLRISKFYKLDFLNFRFKICHEEANFENAVLVPFSALEY